MSENAREHAGESAYSRQVLRTCKLRAKTLHAACHTLRLRGDLLMALESVEQHADDGSEPRTSRALSGETWVRGEGDGEG